MASMRPKSGSLNKFSGGRNIFCSINMNLHNIQKTTTEELVVLTTITPIHSSILKVGKGTKKSQNFELLSQMILGESSPIEKKRKASTSPASLDDNSEEWFCGQSILKPGEMNHEIENRLSVSDPSSRKNPKSPKKNSPRSISISLPLTNPKRSNGAKRNLSPEFNQKSACLTTSVSPHRKSCDLQIDPLDATVLEYVKASHNLLESIWCSDDDKPGPSKKRNSREKSKSPGIIEETPNASTSFKQSNTKWKLKEKYGAKEYRLGKKKMIQAKLCIHKKEEEDLVDLSKLKGYTGGVPSNSVIDDDEIITPSPDGAVKKRVVLNNSKSLAFKPVATSTQIAEAPATEQLPSSFDRLPCKESDSPNYAYARGAVRGKAKRTKLKGWECKDCEKYYGAQNLSPKSLQEKLDACSRHRSKYKQCHLMNETPSYFWNPLFPDSDE